VHACVGSHGVSALHAWRGSVAHGMGVAWGGVWRAACVKTRCMQLHGEDVCMTGACKLCATCMPKHAPPNHSHSHTHANIHSHTHTHPQRTQQRTFAATSSTRPPAASTASKVPSAAALSSARGGWKAGRPSWCARQFEIGCVVSGPVEGGRGGRRQGCKQAGVGGGSGQAVAQGARMCGSKGG